MGVRALEKSRLTLRLSARELRTLSSKEVQDYIRNHENDDVQNLLLHHTEDFGLPFGLIADQILGRKKIFIKSPAFYTKVGVVYPSLAHLEQSSSEITAKFKIRLILKEKEWQKLKSIADLSGGFGVDSYHFSMASDHLDFVEPNENLLAIVKHNFDCFKITNTQFHHATAEAFLQTSDQKRELIFIDPSRRDTHKKKVFRISECQPDIKMLLPKLFEVTEHVLIKASPLLDIQQGVQELAHVKKIIVVAVKNECKELLFLLQKKFSGQATIESYNLDNLGEIKEVFSFSLDEEHKAAVDIGELDSFLYEPNAAILKSGALKLAGARFGLKKLHPNTHLFTHSEYQKDFPGRIFKIVKEVRDSKDVSGRKANIITRNYPLKAEELKKKLKLEDGGANYVIAFTGMRKKHVVLASRLE